MKKISNEKYQEAKRLIQIKDAQTEQDRIIANADTDKFIVRLYDSFDGYWIDVSKPVTLKQAKRIYNKETKNGTRAICYDDITYYQIFPANTKMLHR